MPVVHFLNVNEGDCSIIQHGSGQVSVLDVCNARQETEALTALRKILEKAAPPGILGTSRQKQHPVNPITYMQERRIGANGVFRFVLTHPDMDHIDGIRDFFAEFEPVNFWDTENDKAKDFEEGSPYRPDDWDFYKSLRDGKPDSNPRRLTLLAGAKGKYWNQGEDGTPGGDGLHVLAPTQSLIDVACKTGDYNDCSYVILYRTSHMRVLFAGDSHDNTWEHVLAEHADDVQDVDLLIAPHHGRKSGRSFDFLDVVNPALTFFGNAPSEDLAYDAWHARKLPFITNNQAGCMVADAARKPMQIYVTNEAFARKLNPATTYNATFKAWYCLPIQWTIT